MKAIILAAGWGTRMLPITKTIPKELLPVGSKPVIQHTVEGLVDAGIENILIVTSQSKKALEDYFDKNYELEDILTQKGKTEFLEAIDKPKYLANLAFVKQHAPKGTGHAILQAKPWISDDFFMELNGDDLYHPESLKEMVALHKKTGKAVMLLKEVPREDVVHRGVVKIQDGYVVDLIEKPSVEEAPSTFINTGCIIYPQKMFELLGQVTPDEKSGEIYPWPAFKQIMKEDGVIPYVSPYSWKPIGNHDLWMRANIEADRLGRVFE